MQIQTFSIVVGTKACNAACPFCVSSMTGFQELPKRGPVNIRHFRKACRLAQLKGTTTVLLTGKGEPTLYPEEITQYLELLQDEGFPFIELQTNALEIGRLARNGESKIPGLTAATLALWRNLGLNTVAISTAGIDPALNARIYNADYPDQAETIAYLRRHGFTVRLCVMMMRGGVDTPEKVREVVAHCKKHGVDQLKMQVIRKPDKPHDDEASRFVTEFGLDEFQEAGIVDAVRARATKLMTLMHGAVVYDFEGQNLCLSDCLTMNAESDDIRTLIFYSDGRLTYDWQHEGAVLLSGSQPEGELLVQIRDSGIARRPL